MQAKSFTESELELLGASAPDPLLAALNSYSKRLRNARRLGYCCRGGASEGALRHNEQSYEV